MQVWMGKYHVWLQEDPSQVLRRGRRGPFANCSIYLSCQVTAPNVSEVHNILWIPLMLESQLSLSGARGPLSRPFLKLKVVTRAAMYHSTLRRTRALSHRYSQCFLSVNGTGTNNWYTLMWLEFVAELNGPTVPIYLQLFTNLTALVPIWVITQWLNPEVA